MKTEDFSWMLSGCHRISDVAAAYFSDVRVDSATRTFRRQVRLYPKLFTALLEAGYTEHITVLTPVHIAAVIHAWGMPGMAREEAELLFREEKSKDIF